MIKNALLSDMFLYMFHHVSSCFLLNSVQNDIVWMLLQLDATCLDNACIYKLLEQEQLQDATEML